MVCRGKSMEVAVGEGRGKQPQEPGSWLPCRLPRCTQGPASGTDLVSVAGALQSGFLVPSELQPLLGGVSLDLRWTPERLSCSFCWGPSPKPQGHFGTSRHSPKAQSQDTCIFWGPGGQKAASSDHLGKCSQLSKVPAE